MINQTQSKGHKEISPSRNAAFRVLLKVARETAYVHVAWRAEVGKKYLSQKDAGLAQEILYGVLTWQRLLDEWIRTLSHIALEKMQLEVLIVLRMGLFQIRFLERVPAYAAVSDAVEQSKQYGKGASLFVNGILRAALREKNYIQPAQGEQGAPLSVKDQGIRLSFPDFMVQILTDAFGEMAYQIMNALNQKPARAVRVNSLKATTDQALEALQHEGIQGEPSCVSPYGIRLGQGAHPEGLKAFQNGLISMQGESSMLVAPLFGNLKGKSFLDACAAPGGKGLHVAEIAEDLADVTMVDLHAQRVGMIKNQVKRLGLHSVKVIQQDARQIQGQFDAILLDAPCSGIGTIARKPDIKWTITEEDIEALASLQSQLLDALAQCVMPEGTLLYTTCTLSPKENEEQIKGFLMRHPEFELRPLVELNSVIKAHSEYNVRAGMTYIFPQDFHGDGFFLARLQKTSQIKVKNEHISDRRTNR